MDLSVYLSIQAAILPNIVDFDKAVQHTVQLFQQENVATIRSIVAQEYQKFVKENYRGSHSSEGRKRIYRHFLRSLENGEKPGVIVRIALKELTSPALAARIIIEEYLKEKTPELDIAKPNPDLRRKVSELLKNHCLITDRDLGYEVLLAKVKDHSYGPIAEAIKHNIGEEYEQKIKDQLTALDIPYSDEHVLRNRGYDKTPDVKLEVPIAVNGKVINWIESKALFGDRESHEGYLRDQFWSYWNRFGSGLVIYWFGYIKQLDSNTEAGIQLADRLPTLITRYDPATVYKAANDHPLLSSCTERNKAISSQKLRQQSFVPTIASTSSPSIMQRTTTNSTNTTNCVF